MSRKFYTILVVPDATAKFRRIRISRNLLLAGVAVLALLVVVGALFPHFMMRALRVEGDNARLSRENGRLKNNNKAFQSALSDLRGQVSELETRAGQLAMLIGITDLPFTPQPAAGGGGPALEQLVPDEANRVVVGELDLLRERSGTLHESLRTLDLAYTKQARLLSSTPSITPAKGLYGNGYGWRRDPFTGMRDFHQGLDIVAPAGSRVVAPADGVVTRVGVSGGFGKSIILSHGYGVVTRYAHLQGYNVKRGQKVRRGDILGLVGNSGRSTGPHLHYEVQVHQRNVDPLQYILDDFRRF